MPLLWDLQVLMLIEFATIAWPKQVQGPSVTRKPKDAVLHFQTVGINLQPFQTWNRIEGRGVAWNRIRRTVRIALSRQNSEHHPESKHPEVSDKPLKSSILKHFASFAIGAHEWSIAPVHTHSPSVSNYACDSAVPKHSNAWENIACLSGLLLAGYHQHQPHRKILGESRRPRVVGRGISSVVPPGNRPPRCHVSNGYWNSEGGGRYCEFTIPRRTRPWLNVGNDKDHGRTANNSSAQKRRIFWDRWD